MKKLVFLILFLLIFLLGAFLRFWWIGDIPLGLYVDEAMNGNNALEALQTGEFKIFYPENNGREGLFINIQALAMRIFGREPWVLRSVSALIGTLTTIGIYLLSREIFIKERFRERNRKLEERGETHAFFRLHDSRIIALLAAFFLATSYWHLNFSRIGFRAILVPLLTTFGFYFLLRGLRRGGIFDLALGGVIIGLGFHTYIPFRVVPAIAAIPMFWHLRLWWKNEAPTRKLVGIKRNSSEAEYLLWYILLRQGFGGLFSSPSSDQQAGRYSAKENKKTTMPEGIKRSCVPCAIVLFVIMATLAAAPMGLHFLENPQDFSGRTGQVSIFTADNPFFQLARSGILTVAMLFVFGDCNWRHNLPCSPELNPMVAISFLAGFLAMAMLLFRRQWRKDHLESIHAGPMEIVMLLVWVLVMALPAVLTKEGLPHALRSLGMIPPVMIIAGFGAWWLVDKALEWLESQKPKWPQHLSQISRVQKELVALAIFSLLFIPVKTYRDYFGVWAHKQNTYEAFTTSIYNLGKFLDKLPVETEKLVVVNTIPWVRVRGLPMEAQPVMFATQTFREENRTKKNSRYLNTEDIASLELVPDKKAVIAIINDKDKPTIRGLERRFPAMRVSAPGDFIIFMN